MIGKLLGFSKSLFAAQLNRAETPYKLFFVLTKKCQSRCQNCKIWREVPENELSFEEIVRFAERNRYFRWINLSGGEITLRDDLDPIIETLVRNSPRLLFLNFAVNGIDPPRTVSAIEKAARLRVPFFVVTVSIDGPEKSHDALRGIKGDFSSAVETLRAVRKIPGVKAYAGMTLYKKNHALVEETYREIRARIPDFKPWELHLNLAHSSGHYYGNSDQVQNDQKILADAFSSWVNRRGIRLSPFALLERRFQAEALKFIETARTPVPCSALKSSVYLSEKGDVYPCTIWGKKLGNIRENDYDLLPVLRADATRETRSLIVAGNCPQCWTPCEAYPSLLDRGIVF